MQVSKHLQHWYWKAGKFGKNLMAATVFLAFIVSGLAASAFVFWVKLQIVIWMFG